MKKSVYIIFVLFVFVSNMVIVDASSGRLKSDSIKTCNGITYGSHSSDNHWHVASMKNGSYYATGSPIYSDPCGLNNSSENSYVQPHEENNTNTINEVFVEEEKSSDNLLKSVEVDNNSLIVSEVMTYNTNKEKVDIKVTTNNDKATYEIKNNSNLKVGENLIYIDVKAENGNIKNYMLNVNREKELSSEKGIIVYINNKEIEFKDFKATFNVSSNEEEINIDYKLKDKNTSVKMSKISKLKTGKNNIDIIVTAEDGSENKYQLNVYKNSTFEDFCSLLLTVILFAGLYYFVRFITRKFKKQKKS